MQCPEMCCEYGEKEGSLSVEALEKGLLRLYDVCRICTGGNGWLAKKNNLAGQRCVEKGPRQGPEGCLLYSRPGDGLTFAPPVTTATTEPAS